VTFLFGADSLLFLCPPDALSTRTVRDNADIWRCGPYMPGAESQAEMHGKEFDMTAQHGDTVRVQCSGMTGEEGMFGRRQDDEPLEFNIGKGQVIAGLEEAVLGMRIGEEKTVVIPMEKAFGRRDDRNIVLVRRERLPRDLALEVGKHVVVRTAGGRRAVFSVANVLETSVALSANHPFSGKDITLRISLLEIAR
jgi:peptidylprolyl isomerase